MERVYFIENQGKKILIEDFSKLQPGEEFTQVIDTARKIIRKQPEGSVLAVLDATGSIFNRDVLEDLKEFVKGNSPYIKSSAVVGVEGLLQVALSTVIIFSGRSIKTFKDRQSAMDWLVRL